MKTTTRIFITCHSKTCIRSGHSQTRCTLSFCVLSDCGKQIADDLNVRGFCTFESDIPYWKVSPDKPGFKKLWEKSKATENTDLDLLDLIGEAEQEIP